jgi:hypothetical protein
MGLLGQAEELFIAKAPDLISQHQVLGEFSDFFDGLVMALHQPKHPAPRRALPDSGRAEKVDYF